MKRIALIMCVTLMAAIAVSAQDNTKPAAVKPATPATPATPAASALPSLDEILDKNIKALGGKEAIEKLSSRSAKGTFDIEAMGMSGNFESIAKAPNKNAMSINIPGFGVVNNVFDGEKGWAADPMSGVRELAGAELDAAKRDGDFHSELNFKKNFPKAVVKSREKVGSAEAYLVEATPASGGPEKFYFDVQTGLLIRRDAERDSPQGKMEIEIYFDDYKAVDGVKIPHTLKQVTPAFSLSMKFSEIKHNVEIDEKKFAKP
jgi:hypothetical protein